MAKKRKPLGRPSDGIKRQPITINLPVVVIDKMKHYSAEHGESGSGLIARLLAEFFRADGKPPGNVRSTLKSKLEQLD
jgi:hypothetical protein